jgi:RNA polymerase sigma-70 factor (ECF subfamily)
MIHGILVSMVPPSEADDLVQDVFVAAWRGIASLRQADHVGGWLAAIARNEGRAALRRRRPLERIPDDLPDPAPPRRDGAEILAAIRALPEAYRETLALRLVEGFTGPEIATATGLTHGSVRVNLHRGMKLLRGALSERGYA